MDAIDFDQLPWESPQTGARFKVSYQHDKQLRLVEFTDEFIETHWCEKGHSGIVLSGTLEVEFKNTVVRYEEGMGIHIPNDPEHCHKARAVTPLVKLFLVEDSQTKP